MKEDFIPVSRSRVIRWKEIAISLFPVMDASSPESFLFIVSAVDMSRLSSFIFNHVPIFSPIYSCLDWRARFSPRNDYLFSQLSPLKEMIIVILSKKQIHETALFSVRFLFVTFEIFSFFRRIRHKWERAEEEEEGKCEEGALNKITVHAHTHTQKYIMNRRLTNARTINEIIGRFWTRVVVDRVSGERETRIDMKKECFNDPTEDKRFVSSPEKSAKENNKESEGGLSVRVCFD